MNHTLTVPTRSTSYTHLRDAFIRALQGRLALGRKDGSVTDAMEFEVGGPMRVLKAVFPNTTLEKHVPFDLFLAPPNPKKPRSIFFRDMGSIEGDWVTTQLFLHYFEGAGPSPPVCHSVFVHVVRTIDTLLSAQANCARKPRMRILLPGVSGGAPYMIGFLCCCDRIIVENIW